MDGEPDFVPLTVRKLKPGAYADWRKAWYDPADPDALWVEQETKAYILRSLENPDEIVALGFLEGDREELRALRGDPDIQRKQQLRRDAMAPHVAEVLLDGSYEVIEVVTREQALGGGSSRPRP